VDFEIAAEDDPRRRRVRAWLARHPRPSGRHLAEAGYVVPHWPAPYGLDADAQHQLIIDEELARAGVRRPSNPIGIGWAAPTILLAGTESHKQRYLWPALSGEEVWCQLFSEPDAGSDLAALATSARRDGDEWVVDGAKIWTSGAHRSHLGILLARTDPDVDRHQGISCFICPMDAPGISISPIVDMTGAHLFNQVFFAEARLPGDALVGAPGDGWRLAKVTLANERVSLSSGGALWGAGPSAGDLIDLVRGAGGCGDPLLRQRLAEVWAEGELLRLLRWRGLSASSHGRAPGPEVSIQKLMADQHGQHIMAGAAALAGTDGMVAGSGPPGGLEGRTTDPVWYFGSLFAPALTIGGGTSAVQRNIIAERVLGLPAQPEPAAGEPPAPPLNR
jgi:alkylation response protein AidB-like acyl-CoA dehydrogenase